MMRISKDQNKIKYDRKSVVFVECNGLKCDKCAFCDYSTEDCYCIPCEKEERKDGRTGYFRQTNVKQVVTVYLVEQ